MYRALNGVIVQYITEWRSPFIQPFNWFFIAFVVLLPFIFRFKACGVTLADYILLFGLLFVSCMSKRHIIILGVLTTPAVCGMLSQLINERENSPIGQSLAEISARWQRGLESALAHRFSLALAAVALGVALTAWAVVKDWEKLLLPNRKYPMQEIATLQQNYHDCRLFAYYDYGGLVLYKTRGVPPLFVDGRAENVYPDTVLRDAMRLSNNEKGWQGILQRYHVETLLLPKDNAMNKSLAADSRWQFVTKGPVAKIWVRKTADCLKRKS